MDDEVDWWSIFRYEPETGKWKVTFKGKTPGRFDTKEAAERCYEKASRQNEKVTD